MDAAGDLVEPMADVCGAAGQVGEAGIARGVLEAVAALLRAGRPQHGLEPALEAGDRLLEQFEVLSLLSLLKN